MLILLVLATASISTLGFAYVYYKWAMVSKKFELKAFIAFVIGVLIVGLIQYFQVNVLGYALYFIFYPVLFYLMKPISLKKIIFYAFAIWFYGMFLDLLAMAAVTILHHFFNFNIYSHLFESILTFGVFLMLVILAHIKKIKTLTDNLYKKIYQIKYSNASIIIFAIVTLIMSTIIFINLNHFTTSMLFIILSVVMISMFVLLIKQRINNIENAKFLKTLKENNDFYVKIEDENRIFRHNLNAKLMSIKSVSNKKASILINDLLKEYNKNMKFNNNFKEIPYGFNGIIYQKVYKYLNKLHIDIDNGIKYDIFHYLKPRRYNVFVEKMVIALDNAIEASLKSNEKVLAINLYDSNNCVVVEIKNTFKGNIDLDNLGSINYSTKGSKRGLGLFSALRNNEATMKVEIVNNLFVTKIMAKKRDIS